MSGTCLGVEESLRGRGGAGAEGSRPGEGGVELETESRHENIMKKSEKSISSFQT